MAKWWKNSTNTIHATRMKFKIQTHPATDGRFNFEHFAIWFVGYLPLVFKWTSISNSIFWHWTDYGATVEQNAKLYFVINGLSKLNDAVLRVWLLCAWCIQINSCFSNIRSILSLALLSMTERDVWVPYIVSYVMH